jgi:hypothetical protein
MFPPDIRLPKRNNFHRHIPHVILEISLRENDSISQTLLDLIGEAAFDDLCAVFGGTKLSIHRSDACLMRLTPIVGKDTAIKIINMMNGEMIEIPKAQLARINQRNQSIGQDSAAGMTQREMAMKYDLSERQIRNILNSPNHPVYPTPI